MLGSTYTRTEKARQVHTWRTTQWIIRKYFVIRVHKANGAMQCWLLIFYYQTINSDNSSKMSKKDHFSSHNFDSSRHLWPSDSCIVLSFKTQEEFSSFNLSCILMAKNIIMLDKLNNQKEGRKLFLE